jgi:hypothetical protein
MEIGVADGTLKHLLDGGELKPDTRRLVRDWCEANEAEYACAEQAALSIVVSAVPLRLRSGVRQRMIRRGVLEVGRGVSRMAESGDERLERLIPAIGVHSTA